MRSPNSATISFAGGRVFSRGTAFVLLAAAIFRIAACWYWSDDLTRDPDGYGALAVHLAAGDGYVSPDGTPTAFRPPVYPIWLAALGAGGPVAVAAGQVVLGVATVALTCAVGGWLGLKRFALLAGLVVACDPLLLRYAPRVMTETICAFLAILLIGGVLLQQKAMGSGGRSCAGSRWRVCGVATAFGVGLVMGLAALARPTFWAVIVLILADACLRWLWPSSWQRQRSGPVNDTARQTPLLPLSRSPPPTVSRSLTSALLLIGLLAMVAPWAIRNAIKLGEPIITTTHGGYTLLLANNPVFWEQVVRGGPGATWEGESLAQWQSMLEREMARSGIAASDELARDRWARRRAIANIWKQPLMFFRASLYRLGRFWALAPLDPAGETPAGVSLSVSTFYGVVFALAAWGLIACWREGLWVGGTASLAWRSLLWLILAFVIVHAVYWTDTRMRAPVIPALALFAARGGRDLWQIGRVIFRRKSSVPV